MPLDEMYIFTATAPKISLSEKWSRALQSFLLESPRVFQQQIFRIEVVSLDLSNSKAVTNIPHSAKEGSSEFATTRSYWQVLTVESYFIDHHINLVTSSTALALRSSKFAEIILKGSFRCSNSCFNLLKCPSLKCGNSRVPSSTQGTSTLNHIRLLPRHRNLQLAPRIKLKKIGFNPIAENYSVEWHVRF
jgi:hypothetical protein